MLGPVSAGPSCLSVPTHNLLFSEMFIYQCVYLGMNDLLEFLHVLLRSYKWEKTEPHSFMMTLSVITGTWTMNNSPIQRERNGQIGGKRHNVVRSACICQESWLFIVIQIVIPAPNLMLGCVYMDLNIVKSAGPAAIHSKSNN